MVSSADVRTGHGPGRLQPQPDGVRGGLARKQFGELGRVPHTAAAHDLGEERHGSRQDAEPVEYDRGPDGTVTEEGGAMRTFGGDAVAQQVAVSRRAQSSSVLAGRGAGGMGSSDPVIGR